MLPSSHPALTASQQNLERKRAESQIPARKSGENSRRKLLNVVTDSRAKCIGCDRHAIVGNPDKAHVSTSYVERQNLTMRMNMRRFTRLTNAFSKNVENHAHAIALHFMHYNFARVHQTLKSTPAMRAGVADHLWSIEEIVDLLPPLKYNTRPKKTTSN